MWKWIVVAVSIQLSYFISFELQSNDLVQFRRLHPTRSYDLFRYCTVHERLEYSVHHQFRFLTDLQGSRYPHEETRQAFRHLKKEIIPRVMHCARRIEEVDLTHIRAPLYEQLGPNITHYIVTLLRVPYLDYPYHLYPLYHQE